MCDLGTRVHGDIHMVYVHSVVVCVIHTCMCGESVSCVVRVCHVW